MALKEVVIVSAARTAIGKFMGTLKDVSARELAMTAAKGAIERSGVPADQIDEICMGQLYGGMQGSLPARQVGKRVGLPDRSSAVSVNQNCTSGMRALEIACHNIMLGQTEIGLVVGVESMTNAPYLLPKGRMGYRMGQGNIED
ncbi:MAG: acetyl-CoA C-acetyltransferase, partial [Candidatus Contendobacter sp.]|nr:acetyl-CoA C-acetyltransferase [Candidatus Contendobacter sp.]